MNGEEFLAALEPVQRVMAVELAPDAVVVLEVDAEHAMSAEEAMRLKATAQIVFERKVVVLAGARLGSVIEPALVVPS